MSKPSLSHLAPGKLSTASAELSANNAFIGQCLEFDALIAKLQAARALHFGVDAEHDRRDWAEAGSVAHINEKLADALRFLTGTEG